jgi:ferredoxin
MKRAIITERCLGDPICFARVRCPAKAIRKSNRRTRVPIWFFKYSEVDPLKCAGCGNCLRACLHKAIILVPVEEHIRIEEEMCHESRNYCI